MSYNYLRAQTVADRIIKKRGAQCVLRRSNGGDRDCWAVVVDFHPRERNDTILATDRLAIVSAKGLDIPPDNEVDQFVTFDETGAEEVFNIATEPGKLAPTSKVVYWELQIRPG